MLADVGGVTLGKSVGSRTLGRGGGHSEMEVPEKMSMLIFNP
jgi:hypothetical protein